MYSKWSQPFSKEFQKIQKFGFSHLFLKIIKSFIENAQFILFCPIKI